MQYLQSMMMVTLSVLICLSVHEASHGFMAYALGDNTAKNQGRLTLNPIAHIDFLGLLAMIFFRFGWAKPVPVDYRNFKNPKRDSMLVALAGPMSNFVLATVLYMVGYALIMLMYSEITYAVFSFLSLTATISVGLGVFNLIPIPPLDGSHILMPLLPLKQKMFFIKNAQFIQFALVLSLWTGMLSKPLTVLRNIVLGWILSFVEIFLNFIV